MPHPSQEQSIETNVYAIETPELQLDRVKELQKQDPSLQDMIKYFNKGNIAEDSLSSRCLMSTIDNYHTFLNRSRP